MAEQVFGIEVETPDGEKHEYLTHTEVYEVLEKVLGLTPMDLETIQMHGPDPRRVDIETVNLDVWHRKGLHNHIEKNYTISTGKVVKIVKPFEEYVECRVKRIPCYWKQEQISSIFNFFGDVKSITKERIGSPRSKESFHNIKNGNYRIKMKLNRDIPSTLIIRNIKIEIFYSGQEPTCWRCGKDHSKKECKTKFKDFDNRFKMEDFPELGRSRTAPENRNIHEDEVTKEPALQDLAAESLLSESQTDISVISGNGIEDPALQVSAAESLLSVEIHAEESEVLSNDIGSAASAASEYNEYNELIEFEKFEEECYSLYIQQISRTALMAVSSDNSSTVIPVDHSYATQQEPESNQISMDAESDSTWTASEVDELITPAQRQRTNSESPQNSITLEDSQVTELLDGEKKRKNHPGTSSDEEKSNWSFWNSFPGFKKDEDSKKARNNH